MTQPTVAAGAPSIVGGNFQTIFVSEYVCSGAWPDDNLDSSLATEGRTMLLALLRDLLRPDGGFFKVNLQEVGTRSTPSPTGRSALRTPHSAFVRTTWDDRLGEFPWSEFDSEARDRLTVLPVARSTGASPESERDLFRDEAATADAVFVIAPEFFGILALRTRDVEHLAPGRLIGCSSDAVRLCADKLALAEFLPTIGVPTIETHPFDPQHPTVDWPFPIVIKPRDGAGSTLTFRVDSDEQLANVASQLRTGDEGFAFVQQPYFSGKTLSGAALISGDPANRAIKVLPTGEQRLTDDGRLQFSGTNFPGTVTDCEHQATKQLIRRSCESLPGLNGYIGFDLIADTDGVRLVEINPRLTTSWTDR
jgi:predicted ATP-grasp superfamily ATP-dependent carboligase